MAVLDNSHKIQSLLGGMPLRDMYNLPRYTRLECGVNHNAKLKFYPDGNHNLTVASKPIFKEKGWEERTCRVKSKAPKPKQKDGEVRGDSVRRAKQRVFDIARLNAFRWFITWTLDQSIVNRYDQGEISKALKVFLHNKAQRNAAIYLILPERHKDGALHMHGLLSGDFKMIDSGKKTNRGQTIYNMPDWKLGFSTAIELDEASGVISRYITKYISKDFRKIFGSFYYAGGHGLNREPPTQLYDLNYYEVNAKEYGNEYLHFKYADLGDSTSANTQAILDMLGEAAETYSFYRNTDFDKKGEPYDEKNTTVP